MWNNRSILFYQVYPQALLRGLSAVRWAQVACVCFSPECWEGRKSKKMGVWVFGRGESAEYQPNSSRIPDQNPCFCKKIQTNKQTTTPNWRSSKQEWEVCVFSACLLPSVVTFSVSLSFPHVARQENLTGSAWTGWCHLDDAMQMWQLLEKCFYLLLILEGRAAAIAVAC